MDGAQTMHKPIESRIAPILVDPSSGQPLRREGEAWVSDRSSHPVVNGIPRFVSSDQYVGSFSFEWNTHDRTQLDIYRDDAPSLREFVAKTAFTPEFLAGKLVLDAGVGAGRYADVASRWGADVVGVDLSYAVEASQRNLGSRPNVWIAQADIGALPFKPGSFDVIFSIGVLHHTPDTREYFRRLVPLLKPGGTIAIWVYPKSESYVIRERWVRFVNKLPDRMFYAWCRWFVPWAEARLDHPLVGAIKKVFPFPTHGLGIEYDILDTFDGYSPAFHGIHSPEEVEEWFRAEGLQDISRPSDWDTCVRGMRLRAAP
jgi:SAM-dependent methyltransferase